ncbi:MAG TPA: VWA domain-containing protein [Candidatus Binataceae bacterium]|nr:VWA domain-containing protein [Candidatus Binataceae bacterium]
MNALSAELLRFIVALRDAQIAVSVAETLDAMRAVAAAGLEDRVRVREALAAALIKDEADRAAFDETFARFFGAGGGTARDAGRPASRNRAAAAGGGRGASGAVARALDEGAPPPAPAGAAGAAKDAPAAEQRSPAAAADADASAAAAGDRPTERAAGAAGREHPAGALDAGSSRPRAAARGRELPAADGADGDARRRAAARVARRTPFAAYTALEYEAAREALAPLARRFRLRLGRRLHPAPRGRMDFRRTIRASLQHGGVAVDLRFRARRPRHADLLILADVSGSVSYCSNLMLELVAGVQRYFRRVHTFVFVDHLKEAEFADGHVASEPGLDLYARSDFGRVLGDLWQRRSEFVSRATLMLILGDGRNNRRPARADVLRDLRRLCRTAIWLIPEPRERWGTGDSAIFQYAREVDALYPCGNLVELERGLERSLKTLF